MSNLRIALIILGLLCTACSQKRPSTTPKHTETSGKTATAHVTEPPDGSLKELKPSSAPETADSSESGMREKTASAGSESVPRSVQKPNSLQDGLMRFSLELLKKAIRGNIRNNILLSPYSVAGAFSMVYGGARGRTAQQIATVMGFGSDPEHHARFHELEKALMPEDGGPHLEIAYGIWLMKGFSLRPAYEKLVRTYYSASLKIVDFSRSAEAARRINSWVEHRTHRMIRNLVSPSALGPLTRLVLVNALYFRGEWQTKFRPHATRTQTFHAAGGHDIQVNMMHRSGMIPFYEGSTGDRNTTRYRVVRLPYRGRGWSLVVMLPLSDAPAHLVKIIENITYQDIRTWITSKRTAYVKLGLPRFTISGSYSLARVLSSMGMPDAFSERADFSRLVSGHDDLYVSDVLHKTRMEVDETGTKAAAATGIIMQTRGLMRVPDAISFICDHPFMVLLVHEPTQTVLFTGIVARPDESGS